jgi:hypothetical protein
MFALCLLTKQDDIESGELDRVREAFQIPHQNRYKMRVNCTLHAVTTQDELVARPGNLCLFESYVCFFQYLPHAVV